ncbi:Crp/Fnr family transcriptional regulator [Roseateles sp. BYS87W]|uniref:Crp/Fnr family transcriptional regulator n=1 Tax=Pelomonas baiyunensis TaxID=3299026 RepID=A0ABW7H0Y8_9BURK
MPTPTMDPALRRVFEHHFPEVELPAPIAALIGRRRLAARRSVFVQGQQPTAFYAVAAGEIEARFTGLDGGVSVLEHLGPPRLFGLAAFAAHQASAYEAMALCSTELLVFNREAYRRLMDEVPGFARALMAEFAGRYDGTLRLLQAARHQTAAERLSLALAQLRRERGESLSDGSCRVRATQQEVAQLAHLSRQTVNELLRHAQAQGQLRLERGGWRTRPL